MKNSEILDMAKLTEQYCKNKKYPVIIIEGASWVGYTFLFYFILKKKLKNSKFIYHSHNIEYLLKTKK